MLKDKFDKLKFMVNKNNIEKDNKEDGPINNKKKIENLVVFLVILIITIIIINYIWNDKEETTNDNQITNSNKKLAEVNDINNSDTSDTNNLNSELEGILTNISGVGKVKVMITYASSETTIPVYNEESSEENTEETDSEGGTRKVTQTDVKKEVIYEESDGGGKTLITQSIISPTIEGAIITAEGASDASVKTNIIQAVGAVTGLATHKIQVFEMARKDG